MPSSGEFCGGEVAEGLVWSVVVVFEAPVFDEDLGFEEAVEGFEFEEFASEVAVERFDVRVLPGGTGLDVGDAYAMEPAPVAQGVGDEFGSVVATQ